MVVHIDEQEWKGTPSLWRREVWFSGAETIEELIGAVSNYGKELSKRSEVNFDWKVVISFIKEDDDLAASFNTGGLPLPGWATSACLSSGFDECPSN
jgi:hypothetical protein|tara:strand:- start:145 stop:435 length:291 start_codon:yes stop_codon:yes gene_type:complete